jgi:hypothetical protein
MVAIVAVHTSAYIRFHGEGRGCLVGTGRE